MDSCWTPQPHGEFTHPRACSTNGVVAGFAPLRSNTPFTVRAVVGSSCSEGAA